MTLNIEVEKIPNPPLMRKQFRTDEVYRMIEAGILPEESGWELIDGEIIHQMPTGSKHAATVKRLNSILTRLLRTETIVSVQDPIHIDEHNEPEPDIALLERRDDFYAESHPQPDDVRLIIEVSDSTLEYDRQTKKKLYAEAGIREFWLVNLQSETIETYSDPANGEYYQMRIFGRGEKIRSRTIAELVLEINTVLGGSTAEREMED